MINLCFFKWFQNVIDTIIGILLYVCVLSCINVFTSPFDGAIRIYLLLGFFTIYCILIYLFKNKILELLRKIIDRIDRLNIFTMNAIIIALMLFLKVLYTSLFYFDPTQGSDIQLYVQLAKEIVANHSIPYQTISHLAGVGVHLAFFDMLSIPYHFGLYVLFFCATLINFNSFAEIIGKNKSFLLMLLYILMPSSVLLTFCPTHEVFVYFYFSCFLFLLNRLVKEKSVAKILLTTVFVLLIVSLNVFVSPMGYVLCIILLLVAALSNVKTIKKLLLVIILFGSVFMSNGANKYIGSDEYITTMNTYTILIHGSNIDSLGEQVDGYPEATIRKKVKDSGLNVTTENLENAGLEVVKEQYVGLLKSPKNLIKLLGHKFYIMWSGDYYPIEMAYEYDGIPHVIYYPMLIMSALIYLFMLSIGIVYAKRAENDIFTSNYELALLGVLGVSVLTVVLNKYTIFITPVLYFVCMYRAELESE